jgi:hypothetical protein
MPETWALEFYDWGGGVSRAQACPSYGRFLRRRLGKPVDGFCAAIDVDMLEETVAEQYCGGGEVAAIFAVGDPGGEEDDQQSLLCVYDRNSEAWRRAASKTETAETCPICFEPYDENHPREGPLGHPWPTTCTHWACRPCWERFAGCSGSRCPICREDVAPMLASLFPMGPQARALKASQASMEQLLASGWASEPVRRGAGGTFSVRDVLRAACEGPPPDWAGLEARKPSLALGTDYEAFRTGEPCVAVATGDTLMHALRLLGDRLRSPLPPDEAPVALLTPLVVMETFMFYRGEEVMRHMIASPRRMLLVAARRPPPPDEDDADGRNSPLSDAHLPFI